MAKFSVSVPDDLYKRLEAAAKAKGETVSGFVADAVTAYLSRKTGDGSQGSDSSGGKAPPSTGGSASDSSLEELSSAVKAIGQRITNCEGEVVTNNMWLGNVSNWMNAVAQLLYAIGMGGQIPPPPTRYPSGSRDGWPPDGPPDPQGRR